MRSNSGIFQSENHAVLHDPKPLYAVLICKSGKKSGKNMLNSLPLFFPLFEKWLKKWLAIK